MATCVVSCSPTRPQCTRQAEITYATSDNVQALEALYTTSTATVQDTYTHTALGLGAYTRDGVRTSIIRDPDGQPLAFDTLNGTRHYPYLDPQGTVQALIITSAEIAGTYTPYGTMTRTATVWSEVLMKRIPLWLLVTAALVMALATMSLLSTALSRQSSLLPEPVMWVLVVLTALACVAILIELGRRQLRDS